MLNLELIFYSFVLYLTLFGVVLNKLSYYFTQFRAT